MWSGNRNTDAENIKYFRKVFKYKYFKFLNVKLPLLNISLDSYFPINGFHIQMDIPIHASSTVLFDTSITD